MILLFNMGVPMIVPAMFFMILALIPIVCIEAFFISKRLAISFRRTVGSVIFGNIVSTIIGIPVTWFLLFVVQIITGGTSFRIQGFWGHLFSVTVQAPWLPPFPEEKFWAFHAAALFLLIPFFFATWLVEYVMMRNKLAIEIVNSRNEAIEIKQAEQ